MGLRRNCAKRRFPALSGDPYRIEELADFELEPVAVAGQRLRHVGGVAGIKARPCGSEALIESVKTIAARVRRSR